MYPGGLDSPVGARMIVVCILLNWRTVQDSVEIGHYGIVEIAPMYGGKESSIIFQGKPNA